MRRHAALFAALVTVTACALGPLPAAAQTSAGTGADRISASARVDVANAYFFRGLRQDDTGVIVWPQVQVGARVYAGDGRVRRLTLHARSWNSLHSGATGSDGLSGQRWYESNAGAGLAVAFARGVTAGASYTVYTSPNDMFTTVKEVSLTVGLDGGAAPGRLLHPYALVAFELDTSPGVGQADGGFDGGTYLEIGAAPGYTAGPVAIAFPVKIGVSLDGYYELAGRDRRFGFVSGGGMLTIPLGRRASIGAWTLHAGVEYQALGETTKALNLGDGSNVVGSIGVGWSR